MLCKAHLRKRKNGTAMCGLGNVCLEGELMWCSLAISKTSQGSGLINGGDLGRALEYKQQAYSYSIY